MEGYSQTDFAQVIIAIIQVVIATVQLLLSGYTIYFLKKAFEQGNKNIEISNQNIALANQNNSLQINQFRSTIKPVLSVEQEHESVRVHSYYATLKLNVAHKDAYNVRISVTDSLDYIGLHRGNGGFFLDSLLYSYIPANSSVEFIYMLKYKSHGTGITYPQAKDLPPKIYLDLEYMDELGHSYYQKMVSMLFGYDARLTTVKYL